MRSGARNDDRYVLAARALTPEAVAVPIHRGLRFDLDVSVNAGLAGEPQLRFVADAGKTGDRSQHQSQFLEQTLSSDVFLSLFNVDSTTGAVAEAVAVGKPVLVNPWIKVHPLLKRRLAEICPGGDFDRLVLFDKFDLRHRGGTGSNSGWWMNQPEGQLPSFIVDHKACRC